MGISWLTMRLWRRPDYRFSAVVSVRSVSNAERAHASVTLTPANRRDVIIASQRPHAAAAAAAAAMT